MLAETIDNSTTTFVHHGNQVLSQHSELGSFYLHLDQVGSVVFVSDAEGVLAYETGYAPGGGLVTERPFNTELTLRYKYVGGFGVRDDGTGLLYMRNRYYSLGLQRFLSVDPIQPRMGDPFSVNPYVYANANAVLYMDPNGDVIPALAVLAVAETIADIGFLAYDISQLYTNLTSGCPDYEEAVWSSIFVATDVVMIIAQGGNSAMLLPLRAFAKTKRGRSLAKILYTKASTQAPKSPLQVAQEGGRHAGFLRNYAGKSPAELKRGIASLEKQIVEHQNKIADPENYIPNFNQLDLRQQKALLESKWPGDIRRLQEQADILRGLLDN